jgi:aspartate/tyrosine/aromatic aminotransferase
MCQTLLQLPPRTVILLHASCHNPSGLDLSREEWEQLSKLCLSQQLIPFFDMAYQGLGESIEKDAWGVRYFAEQGHEMLLAFSFSKSLGLYGERVGALYITCREAPMAVRVNSQVKRLIRSLYSNPPLHGGKIAAAILSTPSLRKLWIEELQEMVRRVNEMRKGLSALLTQKMERDFGFILQGKGLFSLLGIGQDEVRLLREQQALYMTKDSRVNLSGLTVEKLPLVAQAISTVCCKPSS